MGLVIASKFLSVVAVNLRLQAVDIRQLHNHAYAWTLSSAVYSAVQCTGG